MRSFLFCFFPVQFERVGLHAGDEEQCFGRCLEQVGCIVQNEKWVKPKTCSVWPCSSIRRSDQDILKDNDYDHIKHFAVEENDDS